jgi:hypothetical protein
MQALIRFLIRAPKHVAHASQFGATGGLFRGLSRHFARSFVANTSGSLAASGSASDIHARSSRPQTQRAAAWEIHNPDSLAMGGAYASL